ncbi:MAG: hypothetical protein IPF43_00885 [Arcobacter sp.]|nr:hypothetical protein [Arcobacter sp.]
MQRHKHNNLKILEKYSNSGKLSENIKYFNSCLQYFTDKYPDFSKC